MKANSVFLISIMMISFDVSATSYHLSWFLQGNHGDTSFTTQVDCNQGNLSINHHFSDFSFSSLMEGEVDNDVDSYFWSEVNNPTHLSIGENNQVSIQYGDNSAITLNLFSLMYSQIDDLSSNDQTLIDNLPVSAGLVPIPFLPASSQHLNGATIASLNSNHNSVTVSLSFIEELQCENCHTDLTLTQNEEDFIFTIHHSGSLDGEPHQFTLTTHISSELMSVLINGENSVPPQNDVSSNASIASSIGSLLIVGSHITKNSR